LRCSISRRASCATCSSAAAYSRVKAGACIASTANSSASAMLIDSDSQRRIRFMRVLF